MPPEAEVRDLRPETLSAPVLARRRRGDFLPLTLLPTLRRLEAGRAD